MTLPRKWGDDGLPYSLFKFLIAHGQLNPIQNDIVELVDQIGGQQQHTVIKIQFAKEHCHSSIPFQDEVSTTLQEHVRFVLEKERISGVRRLENMSELYF